MFDTKEYTYESENHHIEEREVLDVYKKAKAAHPSALVVIEDLPCGHWDVDVCETDEQKEKLLKRRLSKVYNQFRRQVSRR